MYVDETDLLPDEEKNCFSLEVSEKITQAGEEEPITGTVFTKD